MAIREASQESGEAGLAYDWSAVSRSGVCLRAQGERGLQGLPMSWHIVGGTGLGLHRLDRDPASFPEYVEEWKEALKKRLTVRCETTAWQSAQTWAYWESNRTRRATTLQVSVFVTQQAEEFSTKFENWKNTIY